MRRGTGLLRGRADIGGDVFRGVAVFAAQLLPAAEARVDLRDAEPAERLGLDVVVREEDVYKRQVVYLFNHKPELVEMTAWALRIYMAVGFTAAFQWGFQQSFVALGEAKISLFLSLIHISHPL